MPIVFTYIAPDPEQDGDLHSFTAVSELDGSIHISRPEDLQELDDIAKRIAAEYKIDETTGEGEGVAVVGRWVEYSTVHFSAANGMMKSQSLTKAECNLTVGFVDEKDAVQFRLTYPVR
ncbi:hypothetical protein WG922_13525 [Ramlibacter sp. AN1015]|uniref:hypothetical protein n=1 Tax=Ramlibacter sp. AN1015 TaxID=3133428 RepID=UPI0030C04DE4